LATLRDAAASPSTLLVKSKAVESGGEISPDGRWMAYQSDKSGQFEIYVSPFPNTEGGLWQISNAGGTRPMWARNGRELFFLDGKGLLTEVAVDPNGQTPNPGNPRRLLETPYVLGTSTRGFDLRSYDVSPDGQRFLMIKLAAPADRTAAPALSLTVVLNWAEELKARVRAKP
jgi:serine/threonine-protein kinase